jgi:hypothetical protein
MYRLRLNNFKTLVQQLKRTRRCEKGQSIFLVAVVLMSFMLFFQFVVNTGLLVAAKISLQNAADAAAYAGAATQARQMNALSYLNYDMREQYKKFLFRYVFVGSIGNPNFPNSVGGGGGDYDFPKGDLSPNAASNKKLALKVPVVCIPLTSNGQRNDQCLNLNSPNTSNELKKLFPLGQATQMTKSMFSDIDKIAVFQNKLCSGQGNINFFVLFTWLFRGDNDPAILNTLFKSFENTTMTETDKTDYKKTVVELVRGIGLFPKNILTLMRAETIESFLNQPHQSEVGTEQVASWSASPQAERYERTIQAYQSALSNLNTSVMDPSTVIMNELESDQQIKIEPVLTSFNAYVQMMTEDEANGGSTICNAIVRPFSVINAPVGIVRQKSPSTVHYAVKLKAKAKLLFLPIREGGIELEAVAAAKPFGSRIGPPLLKREDFTTTVIPPLVNGIPVNTCTGPLGCLSPNLSIAGKETFYSQNYLKALMSIAVGNTQQFGYDGLMKAQDHAMAPNLAEVGVYNILPPAKSTEAMNKEFIPYATNEKSTLYRFYAPLYPEGGGDPKGKVASFLDRMFASANVGKDEFGMDQQIMKANLQSTINGYISKLQSGVGTENQESLTFAAIELPMKTNTQPNPQYWLTGANEVLSSWGPNNSPRFGYSVKFVTMQGLLSPVVGMADSDGDLEKVSH